MIGHTLGAKLGGSLKMKPSYTNWAPFIGENTRGSENLFNTEYEKIEKVDEEEANEVVPEEVVTHLLNGEKVDTLKNFCRGLNISDKGSKFDMIERIRRMSMSKAEFNSVYAKIYGHSGGWLCATCPHHVVYAIKHHRAGDCRDWCSWKVWGRPVYFSLSR